MRHNVSKLEHITKFNDTMYLVLDWLSWNIVKYLFIICRQFSGGGFYTLLEQKSGGYTNRRIF